MIGQAISNACRNGLVEMSVSFGARNEPTRCRGRAIYVPAIAKTHHAWLASYLRFHVWPGEDFIDWSQREPLGAAKMKHQRHFETATAVRNELIRATLARSNGDLRTCQRSVSSGPSAELPGGTVEASAVLDRPTYVSLGLWSA